MVTPQDQGFLKVIAVNTLSRRTHDLLGKPHRKASAGVGTMCHSVHFVIRRRFNEANCLRKSADNDRADGSENQGSNPGNPAVNPFRNIYIMI